jgi:hypothetical protein
VCLKVSGVAASDVTRGVASSRHVGRKVGRQLAS